MSSDGGGCESGAGTGRRVLPAAAAPARAWAEDEGRSPGESRRLLPPDTCKLPPPPVSLLPHPPYSLKAIAIDPYKTRFQKRKEKLIEALRPPYFILSMIIVMVCVHLWCGREVRARLEWSPGAWRREPWRLFTYGAVHASTAHLALNALVALAVGWRLEREQGWWRVVVVWWCGVCAGALGAGALQPAVHVVGASAAVYALLTAHLPNVCLRFGYVPLWWFRPLSVVVLCASEGGWALLRARVQAEGGASAAGAGPRDGAPPYDHVAWAAHLLGAALGVPLAFIVFTGENSKKPAVVAARVVSAVALAAGAALAAGYYCLYDET